MAAILADDISNCFFLNENDIFQIQISLKYVPSSPVDNKPALNQVMAWRRIGDKPLPGPMMMAQFIALVARRIEADRSVVCWSSQGICARVIGGQHGEAFPVNNGVTLEIGW